MRTYIVELKMCNDNTVTISSKHRTETLAEYTNFITSANYNTFLSEDGTKAQTINMHHVMHMDITFKEETE